MALDQHLEKLRYFKRLSGFSSVREASIGIGISQAGLSKNVSSLEEILEVKLFHRSRAGIKLTKEGEEVLKATEKILAEAHLLEKKLRTLKASPAPEKLKIGMYDSVAVYFFSELQGYLHTLYPDVEIELTIDTSDALARTMKAGALDLAIGVNLDGHLASSLTFVKLFEDHYSFYISSRHDLPTEKMRLLIHSSARDQQGMSVEDHLRTAIRQRGAHRIFNFETLKAMTAQGLGIGVLPTQVAKPLVKKGVLSPFELAKKSRLFGPHNIGILVTKKFHQAHQEFAEDIYRLGDQWSRG